MYETHFGLNKRPFRALATGSDVFVGPQTAAAMTGLKKALVSHDSIVAVHGPVGVGKSTIVRRALGAIGQEQLIITVGRIQLGHDEVLELILEEMGVPLPAGTVQRFATLRRILKEHSDKGRRVFVVVEDAVRLGADALSELEALTASDAGVSEGAGIVLMGDEGLDELLSTPRLKRLKQRMRLRQVIAPLCASELMGYLKHSFRLAGKEFDEVFEAGSAEVLHRLTGGIPRLANNLVESSMTSAVDNKLSQVNVAQIKLVASEEYGLDIAEAAPAVAPAIAEPAPVDLPPVTEPEPEPAAEVAVPEAEPAAEVAAPEPEPAAEVAAPEPEPVAEPAVPEPEPPAAEPAAAEPGPVAKAPPEPGPVEDDIPELIQDTQDVPQLDIDADDLPELIQDTQDDLPELPHATLPDLNDIAPELAKPSVAEPPVEEPPAAESADSTDIPELSLAETNSVPALEAAEPPPAASEPAAPDLAAAQVEPAKEDVPEWDRDPTLAELRPDLDALEHAMAVAQGIAPDPAAPAEADKEQTEEPEVVPEITLDREIQAKIDQAAEEIRKVEEERAAAADDEEPEDNRTVAEILAEAQERSTVDENSIEAQLEASFEEDTAETKPEVPVLNIPIESDPPPAAAAEPVAEPVAADPAPAKPEAPPPAAPRPAEPPSPVAAAAEQPATANDDGEQNPELRRIAVELSRAKTIDDCDDKMAETLFGEEFTMMAAEIAAMAPPDVSANDDVEAEQPAAAAPDAAMPDVAGTPAVNVELESAPKGLDLSASQRLATVRALNASPDGPQPAGPEPVVLGDAPPPSASSPDTPEPIEEQINTSMTQTLKALNARPPEVDDDDEDDDDKKGGFFSRFRRS